jgi:phage N-6-adenine-methyltransferase
VRRLTLPPDPRTARTGELVAAITVIGFKARNHPQQVGARGALDAVDDRWTPLHLWIPWHDRWGFTLDAAASDESHLCGRYFTRETDGLAQPWHGERVWINPPFSDLREWVEKAWREYRAGCPLIVMLVPANRTEQRWWQESIEPYRDRLGSALRTEFLPSRINFASRDNLGAYYSSSAPFGCVLLVWDVSA